MKRLYYSQVEGFPLTDILNDVVVYNPEEIVFLGETEWEITQLTKEFVDALKKLNIKLILVQGSSNCQYYIDLYNELGIDIDNVIFWNTYWINWSSLLLHEEYETYATDTSKFIYPFISLNNRSHIHRCAFIYELAKQKLVDSGVVTWVKHLNENPNYDYQFYDNSVRLLDDDFVTKLDSFLLPNEFHQSFFHVVTEAASRMPQISEKTVIPLLHKKPFVAIGSKDFNKELFSLGFKPYDELIDYSYDSVADLKERTKLFVDNIHKIVNCNYAEMYEILKPKIEFNYNRALEIINSKEFIPDIIKERIELVTTGAIPRIDTVDHRYEYFLK